MKHKLLGPGFAVEIKGIDLSEEQTAENVEQMRCLLYTSPSPRD